ncbi:MAG: hypothetical protein ACRC1K_09825 [Planctomycetia bacterium]
MSAEFPIPDAGDNLQWCDFQHLLLDGQWLVDIPKKRVGWTYRMPNAVHARSTPDGRHWAILPRAPGSQRVSLAAVELPDEAVAKRLTSAAADNHFVLAPGGKISVKIEATASPPGDAAFAERLKDRLTAQFVDGGIDVMDGQPLVCVLRIASRTTGRQIGYTERDFSSGAIQERKLSVAESFLDVKAAITLGGRELWVEERSFNNQEMFPRLEKGQTLEQALAADQWSSVKHFAKGIEPPLYLFPEKAKSGLGTSLVTADGAKPGAAPPEETVRPKKAAPRSRRD